MLLSYLTLGTFLFGTEAKTLLENHMDILQFNFSNHKTTRNGYAEVAVGNSGVVGLQRTITKESTSLRLLELTNGSVIVQLIFSPSTSISDCDVSNSNHHIQRLSKYIHSKYYRAAVDGSYAHHYNVSRSQNLTDIELWSEECYSFHNKDLGVLSTPIDDQGSNMARSKQMVQTDTFNAKLARFIQADEIKKKRDKASARQRRGIMDLTYPGRLQINIHLVTICNALAPHLCKSCTPALDLILLLHLYYQCLLVYLT